MHVDEALDAQQASAARWSGDRRRPAPNLAIGPTKSSHRARFARSIATLLTLAALLGTPVALAQENPGVQRGEQVLILIGPHYGTPMLQQITPAIVETLTQSGFSLDDILVEFLDLHRNANAQYLVNLVTLLEHKLADRTVGVIIAINQGAVDFVAREGRDLLPGVPMLIPILEALPEWDGEPRALLTIESRADAEGTLGYALGLFPRTRSVLIVMGDDDHEAPFLSALTQALDGAPVPLRVETTASLSVDEMLDRVATLPPDAIAFYGSVFNDVTGTSFVPAEVAARVAEHANRPVFAFRDVHIAQGLIGGSVMSTSDLGIQAARIALEYLASDRELTQPITAFEAFAVPLFDWQQLDRWGGNVAALPADTVFLNRPPSLWSEHGEAVVVALVSMTFLALLVVALWVMNRRQRLAIRERMLAVTKLADSEGVFRDIFESTLSGFWDWNLVENTEYLSPAFKRMFGYEDHEMESSPEAWQRIIFPEDLTPTLEVFKQHVESRGRVPFYNEVRYRHRDGSTVWVICAGRVIEWAEDGTALRMVGCHVDITRRIRAEEERERSDERFRIAQDMSPDGFTILRPVRDDRHQVIDFTWVYENEAIARLNGTDPRDVVGKRLLELFPGQRETRFFEVYQHVAESGTPMAFEDGYSGESMQEEAWFRIVVVPMTDDIAILAQDITERKREARELDAHRHHLEELVESRTRELAEARERAETATRAKSAFLANMSHEIRTPINAVAGLTHLLQRDDPTPAQADRLLKIESATGHLVSIVSDVLDLAKIEADRLVIEERDFHLSAVLDHVQSMVAEAARSKGLRLEVDPDGVPVWLRGDPVRLRQALLNLAGNAVKFTHEGHVVLRAELLGEDDSALRVRFEVEDSGIGIRPERIPELFQAFEQADPSVTREYGGTGLGLAITRRLAELMGGEVGAQSERGRGTRIWFTVRLQRGHGVLPVPLDDAHDEGGDHRLLAGARVLLAEDNPINREVSLELLHGFGVDAVAAENGQAAVELARAETFDLILMDMHMPVLDGLSATREIRALPGYARVPILALTANAFEEDRRACLAAGMDGFVPKPVSPPALRRAMAEGLRSAQERSAADRGVTDVKPRLPERPDLATTPAEDGRHRRAADASEATSGVAHQGLPAPLRWPGLEPTVAIRTVGGQADLVRYLNRLFAFHASDARELEAELAAGDTEAATFRVHRLKGAAGTLGVVALQRAAATLESALQEGPQDAGLLGGLVAAVASELGELGRRLAEVYDEGAAM